MSLNKKVKQITKRLLTDPDLSAEVGIECNGDEEAFPKGREIGGALDVTLPETVEWLMEQARHWGYTEERREESLDALQSLLPTCGVYFVRWRGATRADGKPVLCMDISPDLAEMPEPQKTTTVVAIIYDAANFMEFHQSIARCEMCSLLEVEGRVAFGAEPPKAEG